MEVRLKLKSEENEELKSNEFQGCKLPASIIARRSMTEPERRLILEKQGNKCAGVNCKLSSLSGYAYDIDHKVPIQVGGNNDECNLQATNLQVDKLYPLSSLRELDLKTPAFKPVLEILDKELPEYPNLVNDETGKVHCKAVKKLNEIQPTVVKDDEKLFYKTDI